MSSLTRVAVRALEKPKNKFHSAPKAMWDNMLVFSIEERKEERERVEIEKNKTNKKR